MSSNGFMDPSDRIFVAGHRGLAGSAILRNLEAKGYRNILTKTRQEVDLRDPAAVSSLFEAERPKFVFLAAAKVGGILANHTYPADFIRDNLAIQLNVIEAARSYGVKRLLFLGSSCIYPKQAPQPLTEASLLTGPLEITNRAYAIAKIAGVEMCWSYNKQYGTRFLAAMPTNLYGIEDNFDLQQSHVLPAILMKAAHARRDAESSFVVWGTGTPKREFLFSDDLADACVFLLNLDDAKFETMISNDEPPLVNVGTGTDVSIKELAEIVSEVVGFSGEIVYDSDKPDGTPRKLMDVRRLTALGWSPSVPLKEGISRVWSAIGGGI